METKRLTFSGGLILGAGLVYLLDPQRGKGRVAPSGQGWKSGLSCIAGALGVAAIAYGARLIAQGRRDAPTSTALDIDMPNYAWLR